MGAAVLAFISDNFNRVTTFITTKSSDLKLLFHSFTFSLFSSDATVFFGNTGSDQKSTLTLFNS